MNTWTYQFRRAKLLCNGEFFALVTDDGQGALSPDKAQQLLDDLCQARLKNLQKAISTHATEMDTIMQEPSTKVRGQNIALSLGRLEQAMRESLLASRASAPEVGSGLPEPVEKQLPPAVSTPPQRKPRKRLSIS